MLCNNTIVICFKIQNLKTGCWAYNGSTTSHISYLFPEVCDTVVLPIVKINTTYKQENMYISRVCVGIRGGGCASEYKSSPCIEMPLFLLFGNVGLNLHFPCNILYKVHILTCRVIYIQTWVRTLVFGGYV